MAPGRGSSAHRRDLAAAPSSWLQLIPVSSAATIWRGESIHGRLCSLSVHIFKINFQKLNANLQKQSVKQMETRFLHGTFSSIIRHKTSRLKSALAGWLVQFCKLLYRDKDPLGWGLEMLRTRTEAVGPKCALDLQRPHMGAPCIRHHMRQDGAC